MTELAKMPTLVGSGMWVSSEVVERVSDSVNAACFPADE